MINVTLHVYMYCVGAIAPVQCGLFRRSFCTEGGIDSMVLVRREIS
jgi:hypothetical protein